MRIKEITVSRSVWADTGDPEVDPDLKPLVNAEHSVIMTAELEEGDDEKTVAARLTAEVEKALMDQLIRSYKIMRRSLTMYEISRRHGLTHVYAGAPPCGPDLTLEDVEEEDRDKTRW